MIYHQSNVFLQDLSNSFHCWFNFYILLYSGVPQKFSVVVLVIILKNLKTEEEFSSISFSILFKIRDSSLLPSSHNCFRLSEFFSPIRSNSRVFSVWLFAAHHRRFIHSSFQLSYSKSYRCIIQKFLISLGSLRSLVSKFSQASSLIC